MARRSEYRIAIGTPSGRRSTVWKFVVAANEAYILTRMFGADAKISLHGDGLCQFSASSEWVLRAVGRQNQDRHITRWNIVRPHGSSALRVFQVLVPQTELRVIIDDEDLSEVQWLPESPAGMTTSLECYVTPPSDADPSLGGALPHARLFSAMLTDRRWFVILHHDMRFDGLDLVAMRATIAAQIREAGREPLPAHRAALFTEGDGGVVRGLIEFVPTPET